jgi:NhaA family Na+:H+ antiporter
MRDDANDHGTDDVKPVGQGIARREALSPAESLIEMLHPWVAFGIMPLFALANAGVALSSGVVAAITDPVAVGIMLGLVLGKPIGISLASAIAVRAGVAELPTGVTWAHVTGVSVLAGIGFTMSLFIAGLAYRSPALLDTAKLGVLGASICAGVAGYAILRSLRVSPPETMITASVPEADA